MKVSTKRFIKQMESLGQLTSLSRAKQANQSSEQHCLQSESLLHFNFSSLRTFFGLVMSRRRTVNNDLAWNLPVGATDAVSMITAPW